MFETGKTSGLKWSGFCGRNHPRTCLSGTAFDLRAGMRSEIQPPVETTTFPASYRPRSVTTTTRPLAGSIPSTFSRPWISAPAKTARVACAEDGTFRCYKSCIRLIHDGIIVRELVAGEALCCFMGCQHFMGEVVLPARRQRALHVIRLSSAPASIPPVTNRSCSFVSCSASRHSS